MAFNLNKLAKAIAEKEGRKVNLPIGQIKEVMGILLAEMHDVITNQGVDGVNEVLDTIRKYKKRK